MRLANPTHAALQRTPTTQRTTSPPDNPVRYKSFRQSQPKRLIPVRLSEPHRNTPLPICTRRLSSTSPVASTDHSPPPRYRSYPNTTTSPPAPLRFVPTSRLPSRQPPPDYSLPFDPELVVPDRPDYPIYARTSPALTTPPIRPAPLGSTYQVATYQDISFRPTSHSSPQQLTPPFIDYSSRDPSRLVTTDMSRPAPSRLADYPVQPQSALTDCPHRLIPSPHLRPTKQHSPRLLDYPTRADSLQSTPTYQPHSFHSDYPTRSDPTQADNPYHAVRSPCHTASQRLIRTHRANSALLDYARPLKASLARLVQSYLLNTILHRRSSPRPPPPD
jgi:hypothetical protein